MCVGGVDKIDTKTEHISVFFRYEKLTFRSVIWSNMSIISVLKYNADHNRGEEVSPTDDSELVHRSLVSLSSPLLEDRHSIRQKLEFFRRKAPF